VNAKRARATAQSWLPADRVDHGVLRLRDGSLRAVLECPSLALGLKGEVEQRAVMQAWAGLLNSLTHPLQFLVQTRTMDPTSLPDASTDAREDDSPRARLRQAYADLVAGMSARRSVLSRHFYVVVPFDAIPSTNLVRSGTTGGRAGADVIEQRVQWLTDWLRRIDLEPVRLSGRRLASVLYGTLCPETAATQPLPDEDTLAELPELVAPALLEETHAQLHVGARYARTIAISRYPKRLVPGWLDSLYAFEGDLDVSLHVQPAAGQVVMPWLERRIAELSSTVRVAEERGQRADPYRRVALEDAEELQDRIARGEERLFDASLYLTVWADDSDGLEVASRQVEALLGSQLIYSRRLFFQAEPGFVSSLPLGLDRVGLRRGLSTSALAATFPFTGNDLTQSRGLLYGINPEVRSPVVVDRFGMENHNAVVFATSGAGKSFETKTELIRAYLAGIHVHVIDPEGEYAPIVEQLGGTVVAMHPGAPISLDAFAVLNDQPGSLSTRIASLLTLFELLSGGMNAVQRAATEEALSFAYAACGFTDDGETSDLTPPDLAAVEAALERQAGNGSGRSSSDINELRLKLGRYLRGSGRWLFAPATRSSHRGPLVAYVLAGLPEEERAPAMFLVLDRIWGQLTHSTDRTLVVVDEAWWLMQYPDTARFLFRLAKTARKRNAGLTLVTQDVTDVLESPLGEAIVTNAALQVLMKQAPQAMPRLAKLFQLTQPEQSWLLTARQGEGLMLAQGKRVPFQVAASDEEVRLIRAGEQRRQAA
jgi:TraG P-loop domain/Helicase HerA, central domain